MWKDILTLKYIGTYFYSNRAFLLFSNCETIFGTFIAIKCTLTFLILINKGIKVNLRHENIFISYTYRNIQYRVKLAKKI